MKTIALALIFTFCLSALSQTTPQSLEGFSSQELIGSWYVLGIYDLNSELNLNNAYCPTATFEVTENDQISFTLSVNLGYELNPQNYNTVFTVDFNDEAHLEASDSDFDLYVVGYDGTNLVLVQKDTNIAYVLSQEFNLLADSVSAILTNIPQQHWFPDFHNNFHGYDQKVCSPPYPLVVSNAENLGNYYVAGIYIASFIEEVYQCASVYFKDMKTHWEIFNGRNKQYPSVGSWDAFKSSSYPGLLIGKSAVRGVAYLDSEYAVIVEGYAKDSVIATLLSVNKTVPESAYELFAEVIEAEQIERPDFSIWRIDNSQCSASDDEPEIYM